MIIYATFSNQGGMKRIAETVAHHSPQADVYNVIFSEKKPDFLPPNHYWFFWKNLSKYFTAEAVQLLGQQIRETIPNIENVKYVIGDCFTLPYFGELKVDFIYDIHSLSLPLNERLENDSSYLSLDRLTKFPTSNVVRLSQINFSRAEYRWIKRCIAYVSNSINSTVYLKKFYENAIEGKPIFQVPVLSEMNSKDLKPTGRSIPFYTFSRWHPQKGYHLLFNKNWGETPLFVRGISESDFLPEGLDELKSRSINLLPWTDNSSELTSELTDAEIILFPAIYEPYGLALREALASGCLCVAHKNLSGHEEQIRHGENGFLLNFSSPDFMTDLMKIYHLEPSEKNAVKRRAKLEVSPTILDRVRSLEIVYDWLRSK